MEIYFRQVSVKERLPKEKGWFNLISDGTPSPIGRGYFDGNEFDLSRDNTYHYRGMVANGYEIFWLEEITQEVADSEYEELTDEKEYTKSLNGYVSHLQHIIKLRDDTILEILNDVDPLIDTLIGLTPTGERRNELTQLNIKLKAMLHDLSNKNVSEDASPKK